MIIKPLFYMGHLSDDDIAMYECSDKLWLPKRSFEYWITHSDVGVATILKLKNMVEQTAVGLAYKPHSNDEEHDTVYAPQWICDMLDCDNENISVERYEPSLCTGLTILPHTSDHIRAQDPQEFLRDAFEAYTCIQEGMTLTLWVVDDETKVGHTFTITITNTRPLTGEPVCIRNCEVELELLPPLDLPIQKPPTPEPVPEPVPEPEHAPTNSFAESTSGYSLGGQHDDKKTQRELAAAAARRRLQNPTI